MAYCEKNTTPHKNIIFKVGGEPRLICFNNGDILIANIYGPVDTHRFSCRRQMIKKVSENPTLEKKFICQNYK